MRIINKMVVFIIKGYQKLLSPLTGNNCRYYPTCSHYSITAFKRFNFLKALWLSTTRILKCNPLFKGGIDPVPKKKEE